MPKSLQPRDQTWLKSSLRTNIGSLLLAGKLRNVRGLSPSSMRVLGNYALVYILEGHGFYADANGIERRFAPGDALWVFPELAHAYGPLGAEEWNQIYVVFNGPQFDLLQNSEILNSRNPVWNLKPAEYWQQRIEGIFHASHLQHSAMAWRALGQFIHLLYDMAATQLEATQPAENTWLEKSLPLLVEPVNGIWLNPTEIALRVGLSYETFRKRFARQMGESPGQFQKRRRVEHACAAIYRDSQSFKQLADDLGFCDVFHFSKTFRQVVGESPSDFRKKVRGS